MGKKLAKLAKGSHSTSECESDSDSEYSSQSVSESGTESSTFDGLQMSPLSVPDTPIIYPLDRAADLAEISDGNVGTKQTTPVPEPKPTQPSNKPRKPKRKSRNPNTSEC
jgi:hypothetical protein